MSFLPVVDRELRTTARNSRFYWGRCTGTLIAVALIAWFWLTSAGGTGSAQRAKVIFATLSGFFFVYSLLLGIFLTADSISEEKRDGTLGLLFLTNLKGYDVAFGKLASNSFRAIYSLIAIFPVMTIPLLLGGLTGQEIFRMALVLVVSMIFSLTIGLFVSSISRHDRKAQFGALALLLLISGGLPGLIAFLKFEFRWPLPDILFGVSPGFAFGLAFESSYVGNETEFWSSIAAIHAFSWIAFLLAAAVVRTIWQDRPAVGAGGGFLHRYRLWKRGTLEARKRYRSALLKLNAYYWLTARDRLKPWYVLWFLGGCAAFWFILWLYNGNDMLQQETFFVCAIILHTAMKVWIAAEAGRQFSEDRRSSALELTLSTPMPIRDILEGQFLGLLRQFGLPFAAILLFDVTGMLLGVRTRSGAESESVLMWVAIMLVFVVDAVTIATLGMWFGLALRRSSRAIAQNLFYVIVLPWLVLIGFITYISLAPARGTAFDSMEFFIGAYFVVSIVTDLILFLQASGNLTSRFREAATQRFDKPR